MVCPCEKLAPAAKIAPARQKACPYPSESLPLATKNLKNRVYSWSFHTQACASLGAASTT